MKHESQAFRFASLSLALQTVPWAPFLNRQMQRLFGMAGPTGLDYTAVQTLMVLCGIRKGDRPGLFAGIRVLEGSVLPVWSRKR